MTCSSSSGENARIPLTESLLMDAMIVLRVSVVGDA
jgi:hypothetical protein